MQNQKKVYIVLTQTGTILSRILKRVTGAEYNHASISLDNNLSLLYSFGRIFPRVAFIGGFVKESPYFGTFKRFRNTDAIVLGFCVDEEKYEALREYLEYMYEHRKEFHYNYSGLFLAMFRKHHQAENCFTCSEFVEYIIRRFDLLPLENFPKIVKPIDFLNSYGDYAIYRGKLKHYISYYSRRVKRTAPV